MAENTTHPDGYNNDEVNKLRIGGLNYVKHQQNYLLTSIIYPIFCIIVQIQNIFFTLNRPPINPVPNPLASGFSLVLQLPPPPQNTAPQVLAVDLIFPAVLSIIIALFAIAKFIYLMRWRNQIKNYEIQRQISKITITVENDETASGSIIPSKNILLTHLYYNIINCMEKTRIIFYIVNLISVGYLFFVYGFFSKLGDDVQRTSIGTVMLVLNLISNIGLYVYLAFEWHHFRKWNSKLKKLQAFEKQIYEELEFS